MTSVASFYSFQTLANVNDLRDELEEACRRLGLKGTVLLASEGVNAALAGDRVRIEHLIGSFFAGADVKWSTAATGNPVFHRLKVRVKDEIVTFGQQLSASSRVGRRVDAGAWDALLDDPTVVVVDTRNNYESEIGTFRGAKRAATATFADFPDFVRRELNPARDRRIAMFCTGGIRCEKASAFLIEQGFEDVCQLDGGILKYLAETGEGNAFAGECFVFDQRVSVTVDLAQGSYDLCRACRRPVSSEDRRSALYEPGTSCPACHGKTDPARRAGFAERAYQERLATARRERHVGAVGDG